MKASIFKVRVGLSALKATKRRTAGLRSCNVRVLCEPGLRGCSCRDNNKKPLSMLVWLVLSTVAVDTENAGRDNIPQFA